MKEAIWDWAEEDKEVCDLQQREGKKLCFLTQEAQLWEKKKHQDMC